MHSFNIFGQLIIIERKQKGKRKLWVKGNGVLKEAKWSMEKRDMIVRSIDNCDNKKIEEDGQQIHMLDLEEITFNI